MTEMFVRLKSLFQRRTLQKRMVVLSALPILVMAILIIIVLVYNNYIVEEHKKILDKLYFFKEISVEFNEANKEVEIYLAQAYEEDRDKPVDLSTLLSMRQQVNKYAEEIYYSDEWSSVKGLEGMLKTYEQNTADILDKMKSGQPYFEALSYNRDVAIYINTRLDLIVSGYLHNSSALFEQINHTSARLQIIIIISLSILCFILLLFVFRFSKSISTPIIELSKNAQMVAGGDLNVEKVTTKSKDEVSILANAFDEMVAEIKQLIQKIVDQSELEKKLKEEEMKNLQNINMLKEAEIKMLQSQIDPHFLFNTLNIISRTSILENAETTSKLIQTTARLLRYNMAEEKKKQIVLDDEINNVREYLIIYKTRFPEKFQYHIDVDESLLDVRVPYLMLQPLVENAIIHGLEPMAEKGTLTVYVSREAVHSEQCAVVEIADDGLGMDEEAIRQIMSGDMKTGTGVNNVKKRLEYFYKREDIFFLEKNTPKGIRIRIVLPIAFE